MTMERSNLLNMAKLSIKGLIESALSFGRTLDSDYPPLQQFFVVMEHCLKHGLKGRYAPPGTPTTSTPNHAGGLHLFTFATETWCENRNCSNVFLWLVFSHWTGILRRWNAHLCDGGVKFWCNNVPIVGSSWLLVYVSPVKKVISGVQQVALGSPEMVEKLCPEASEIAASVRDLPGLKYVMSCIFITCCCTLCSLLYYSLTRSKMVPLTLIFSESSAV